MVKTAKRETRPGRYFMRYRDRIVSNVRSTVKMDGQTTVEKKDWSWISPQCNITCNQCYHGMLILAPANRFGPFMFGDTGFTIYSTVCCGLRGGAVVAMTVTVVGLVFLISESTSKCFSSSAFQQMLFQLLAGKTRTFECLHVILPSAE